MPYEFINNSGGLSIILLTFDPLVNAKINMVTFMFL